MTVHRKHPTGADDGRADGGENMKYSPFGSGKVVSQTFNGSCLETTFERENELKSEYEIYVNWMNPDQIEYIPKYRQVQPIVVEKVVYRSLLGSLVAFFRDKLIHQ